MALLHVRNFWIIPTSLLLALILTIAPIPDWLHYFRPDWVGLVVIFWGISLPRNFSIGTAWLTGLLLDVLLSTPLGQNALGLVIVVYIASRMHLQFLSAPILQQAFFVSMLLMVKQLVILWINGMTDHLPKDILLYFTPSLLGIIVWPWLYLILRNIGHKHRLI